MIDEKSCMLYLIWTLYEVIIVVEIVRELKLQKLVCWVASVWFKINHKQNNLPSNLNMLKRVCFRSVFQNYSNLKMSLIHFIICFM